MLAPLVLSLAFTVAALVAVVWSGVARRRSLHYGSVVAMLAGLGVAIFFAERYGAGLAFDGLAGSFKTVHFVGVTITFALLPVVVVTGVRLARREAVDRRTWHKRAATAFVAAVLVTFGLGLAMTWLATPV